MYNRTLKIGLFGLDENIAATLQELPAPDRFAFEFKQAATIDYMAALESDIAIAAMGAWGEAPLLDISAALHSDDAGYHALVIVAAPEDVADWTQKQFNMVEAIWPAPLSEARAIYEFERLITDAKQQAEEYIVRSYLDAIIEAVPEMVWFKTLDGQYVKANSVFCDAVNKISWDVEGQQFEDVWDIDPKDAVEALAACKTSSDAAIEAGAPVSSTETFFANGHMHSLNIHKAPIYDEDGTPLGVCAYAHDEIA